MTQNITLEQFNQAETLLNTACDLRTATLKATKEKATLLVKQILPDWEVIGISETHLTFGYKYMNSKDGSYPLYRDLDCYFGKDFWDKEYRFELNTSAFGSFSILEANDPEVDSIREYFRAVGVILGNTEWSNSFLSFLKDFSSTLNKINKDRREAEKITDDYKRQEDKKVRDAEEAALYESQLKEILNGAQYAIIEEDSSEYAKFTYRKKTYKMIELPSSNYDELYNRVWRHNKRKYSTTWKVVEVSKLK